MATDLLEAARLFRQGCDGGSALGCSNLGLLYAKDIGKDPKEAAQLFRQGCDGGSALGCTGLGLLLVEGR
ncbi:MAG: sel1 repeat family protein, partial [Pseudomonadota bacterium]